MYLRTVYVFSQVLDFSLRYWSDIHVVICQRELALHRPCFLHILVSGNSYNDKDACFRLYFVCGNHLLFGAFAKL